MGSRKSHCVNESVRSLQSVARMNDRCLDLMQEKKKENSKKKQTGETRKHLAVKHTTHTYARTHSHTTHKEKF